MKEITFYYKEEHERKPLIPIEQEAADRGLLTEYCQGYNNESEIGVYSPKPVHINDVNSETSFIMPHGIDQYYEKKGAWMSNHWSKFDIGLLPGDHMASEWHSQSWHPKARAKKGVYKVGWPKVDFIATDKFKKQYIKIKEDIGVDDDSRMILYAPGSDEIDGKIDDVIEACEDVSARLFVRYGPWVDTEKIKNNLNDIDTITFLPYDKIDIMYCLELCDMIISEETSVLYESILLDCVPVSVCDWPKGTVGSYPGYKVPEFAIDTKRNELNHTIESIFNNYTQHLDRLEKHREEHYCNVGNSAKTIVDLIECVMKDEKIPLDQVSPLDNDYRSYYYGFRYNITDSIPSPVIKTLENMSAHKLLHRMDDKFK